MFPNRADPKQNYSGVIFPNYNHVNQTNFQAIRPSDCDNQIQPHLLNQPQFMNCHDTYNHQSNYGYYTTNTPQSSNHSNYVHFQPVQNPYSSNQRDRTLPKEELKTRQNPEGSSNAHSNHKVAFTLPQQQAPPMRLPLSTLTNEKKVKESAPNSQPESNVKTKSFKQANEKSPSKNVEPKAGKNQPKLSSEPKEKQLQSSKTNDSSSGFATIQKQSHPKGEKTAINPDAVKPPIAEKPILKKQESVNGNHQSIP